MEVPTRTWLLAFPLLAGCPYLWDPPEFSDGGGETGVVDTDQADVDTDTDSDSDTDTDTDADADSDTDTDTDTDSDTDSDADADTADTAVTVTEVPPDVLSVTPTFGFGVVQVEVELFDADDDLDGGLITIDADGLIVDFDIPGELDQWDPVTHIGRIDLPLALDCVAGVPQSWTATATDAASNVSLPLAATLDVTVADVPDGNQNLGVLALPAMLCGELSNCSDADNWLFEIDPAGSWTFVLDWTAADEQTMTLSDVAVLAQTTSPTSPDLFTQVLALTTQYELALDSPQNGAGCGPYTVVVYE